MPTTLTQAVPKPRSLQHRPHSWLMTGSNLEPEFGGISAVVSSLCESVSAAGNHRTALASFGESSHPSTQARREFPLSTAPWLRSSEPWRALAQAVQSADGVHIHGLWQKHCALSALFARRFRKPYVVSAHGMLDSWALGNKRFKKIVYASLLEGRNLRQAACLHALTRAEAADYSRISKHTPVAVIPNGVTIPGGTPDLFFERFPDLEGSPLVLFLGRIHYKKGLDVLCRSWASVSRRFPDARLVLAGPDFENTQTGVEKLIEHLGIGNRVTFTGMLHGALKWSALAAATVFVLPSYSEGLSVSVLEAMGMGLPVIVSRQCHLDDVSQKECGWVIEPQVDELSSALQEALSASSAARDRLGMNGRDLVLSKYSWRMVGAQMAAVYRWVLGGVRPDCVEVH